MCHDHSSLRLKVKVIGQGQKRSRTALAVTALGQVISGYPVKGLRELLMALFNT